MNNQEVEEHHQKMQSKFNEFLKQKNQPIQTFKFIAVGYLILDEEFEKGKVPKEFIEKLRLLWSEGITLASLGYHTCEFCKGKNKATSSSEKTLIDKENNIQYIFPEMIFHYIEVHNYLPPLNFIKFVMKK